MIKKSVELKTTKVEIVKDVLCNLCGKSMLGSIGNMCGVSVSYRGGYDSPVIGDGEQYEFELCEQCLVDLGKKCVIPPIVRNFL